MGAQALVTQTQLIRRRCLSPLWKLHLHRPLFLSQKTRLHGSLFLEARKSERRHGAPPKDFAVLAADGDCLIGLPREKEHVSSMSTILPRRGTSTGSLSLSIPKWDDAKYAGTAIRGSDGRFLGF
eukprot:symbB.v1.2.029615.t1/scaffold3177.1/size61949/3